MVCIFAVNLGAIAQKMHLVERENATRFSLKNLTTIEKDSIFSVFTRTDEARCEDSTDYRVPCF